MEFQRPQKHLQDWKDATLPTFPSNKILTVRSEGKDFLVQNNCFGNNVIEIKNPVSILAAINMAETLGGVNILTDTIENYKQIIFIKPSDIAILREFVK